MHSRNGVLRNSLLALALLTLVVPQAMPATTPAHAQIAAPTPTAAGAGSVSPGLAFNYLGVEHTATFTCTYAAPAGTAAAAGAGCYAVNASVQNATLGTAASIVRGTCAGAPTAPTTSTQICAFIPSGMTSTVTINPGTPDVFTITFSGYVPALVTCSAGGVYDAATATCSLAPATTTCPGTSTPTTSGATTTCTAAPVAGVCPAEGAATGVLISGTCYYAPTAATCPTYGTVVITAPAAPSTTGGATCTAPAAGLATYTCPAGTGAGATASTGGTPTSGVITGGGGTVPGCAFSVMAQKKYLEITGLTVLGGPCGGTLFWSEALKTYVGPSCTIIFVATGTINIKPVPDCAAELAALANSGPAVAAEFGPTARYVCTGNMLGVIGVSSTVFGMAPTPITVQIVGMGTPTGVTLAVGSTVYCVGGAAPTVVYTGTPVTLCPTGAGTAFVGACMASPFPTQAPFCTDGADPAAVSTTGTGSVGFPVSGPGRGAKNGGLVATAVPTATIAPTPTSVPTSTTPSSATVSYNTGWNQVGGPGGSNLSGTAALFSYNPTAGQYADAMALAASLPGGSSACTGYWAYATAPMSVTVQATSQRGVTQTCPLAPGWNLVGNPFVSPAQIPSSFTAYHWNGTSYDLTSSIPTGGAIWVYNPTGTPLNLTLTAT